MLMGLLRRPRLFSIHSHQSGTGKGDDDDTGGPSVATKGVFLRTLGPR